MSGGGWISGRWDAALRRASFSGRSAGVFRESSRAALGALSSSTPESIDPVSNALKVRGRSLDTHAQTPTHRLLGHWLPKLTLDRRTDVSSAHGAISRHQHFDDRSLYDAVAELPHSWLQLRFRRPGLDSTRWQVQN